VFPAWVKFNNNQPDIFCEVPGSIPVTFLAAFLRPSMWMLVQYLFFFPFHDTQPNYLHTTYPCSWINSTTCGKLRSATDTNSFYFIGDQSLWKNTLIVNIWERQKQIRMQSWRIKSRLCSGNLATIQLRICLSVCDLSVKIKVLYNWYEIWLSH
jgi:hypothetical protein